MRLLVYNIRYGTGDRRPWFPWSGYLRRTADNLGQIIPFIDRLDPDVIGLLEVDEGSWRADRHNQAETIADALGHYHTCRCKYGAASVAHLIPLLNKQGNAFITRNTIANERFHYLEKGMKRLVIELELENVVIFLVHLALTFRARHKQLNHLYSLVTGTGKPSIVAGDFNAWWGDKEIQLFLAATKLANANQQNTPSFPSWSPRRQLDFVLHSPEIRPVRFWMPSVSYSDHLPLVFDFELGSESQPPQANALVSTTLSSPGA